MRVQARKWVRQSLRDAAPAALARSAKGPGRTLAPSSERTLALDADTPALDRSGEQWLDGVFAHRGRRLHYKLYLPPHAPSAAPQPLVMMLHGCTQDAADFAAGTQMHVQARARGVAVVYPEQTLRHNPRQCWNWFSPQHQQRGRGEPAVLAALCLALAASQPIDRTRIFVAGLSAGGAMADILGSCYPDVFAAVGVHSGLPRGSANDLLSALQAMRSGGTAATLPGAAAPPPTIVFHGDADATVDASNGRSIIAAALQTWGQSPADGRTELPVDGQSPQGQGYRHTTYHDSTGRGRLEHWQLHGAGHAWSGGKPGASYTDPAGVDASAQMLRFFLANPMV